MLRSMKKLSILLLLTSLNTKIFAQDKNKVQVENENRMVGYSKSRSAEYKHTIKDSIEFIGLLVDRDLGTSCDDSPGAGEFVFKILSANRKCKDSIMVIIQCAYGQYEKRLEIGKKYKVKATQYKLRHWVKVTGGRYPKLDRYFLLSPAPVEKK